MKQRWLLLAIGLALLPLEIVEGMSIDPADVGLNNLGNTCYMNAALQCLLRTKEITDELNPSKKFEKDSVPDWDDRIPLYKNSILKFAELLGNFNLATSPINPESFQQTIQNICRVTHKLEYSTLVNQKDFNTTKSDYDAIPANPEANGLYKLIRYGNCRDQQDAAEFISLMVEMLTYEHFTFGEQITKKLRGFFHKEQTCKTCSSTKILAEKNPDSFMQIDIASDDIKDTLQASIDAMTQQKNPKIGEKTECVQCSTVEMQKLSPNQSLEIFLRHYWPYYFNGNSFNPKYNNALTAIKNELHSDNNNSKKYELTTNLTINEQKSILQRRPISKEYFEKTIFSSIPQILILTLKRFLFNEITGTKEKILTKVNFPPNILISSNWTTQNCPQKNATYELYGLVMHGGTATGGHYTAYVKNALTKQWWYYNDDTATQSTPIFDDQRIYAAFYKLSDTDSQRIATEIIESSNPIREFTPNTADLPKEKVKKSTQIDLNETITTLEKLGEKLFELQNQLKKLSSELKKLGDLVNSLNILSLSKITEITDGILANTIIDKTELAEAITKAHKPVPSSPAEAKKTFIDALKEVEAKNSTMKQDIEIIKNIAGTATWSN